MSDTYTPATDPTRPVFEVVEQITELANELTDCKPGLGSIEPLFSDMAETDALLNAIEEWQRATWRLSTETDRARQRAREAVYQAGFANGRGEPVDNSPGDWIRWEAASDEREYFFAGLSAGQEAAARAKGGAQ